MEKQGKQRKILIFDIDTKVGDAMLGDYTKANHQIQSFLTQNGFEYYPQSSTYESIEPMSRSKVHTVVLLMIDKYPHLKKIVRNMRVFNISRQYTLNDLFQYDGTPYMNGEEERN
jgi:virulence-associated protein VapD